MAVKYLTCAQTAKLIRAALKAAFPTVKFSVRSNTYSGGASIDVTWTDGPTDAMVQKITEQFAGATFDAMADLKNYHDSELNGERVHFGADFVFTRRQISPELMTRVAERVCKKYGVSVPQIMPGHSGAWIDRSGPPVFSGGLESAGDLVYSEARRTAMLPLPE